MTEQNNVNAEQAAEVNPLERSLELVVSYADAEVLVQKALRRYAKDAKIPGFRKGHVPADQVRRMYGPQAFDEAVNELIGQAWMKAADESKLAIAGMPKIDAVPVEDDKENMHFKAVFEILPDVEIPDFSAIELKRYVCPVTDAEVEQTVKVMLRQRATYSPVERAAKADDRVKVNFKGTKDGEAFQGGSAEGYTFDLGQGRMLPEFEAAVEGMNVGEKKTFPLTFPADYGIKELEGQPVEFEVELVEVSEPQYPALDDEFAKSLGVEAGVDAMRAEIRANLEREVKARLETKTKAEAMEAADKACQFAVPQVLVRNEAEVLAQQMVRDLTARGLDMKNMPKLPAETFMEQANRRVRLGLFVDALIAKENIAGTDEQVRAMAEDIAASYEKPEEVIEYIMQDQDRLQTLRGQATETNVSSWILEHAKTVEEQLDFNKLMTGQI